MNKPKMLAVDDSLFNRQVLTQLFDAEFDVVPAEDGVEALALLREHGPAIAVVLLDIVMPKKDGLDVLREMQKDKRLRSIPVVVTSSAGDDVFRLKALELGAVDYIPTPFNPILARLRVKSTLATREYDRLLLQNEMLNVQREEAAGYRALLEDTHTAVLEFDSAGNALRYDATIRRELAGTYDQRQLTEIFRQDGVAEPKAIAELEALFERAHSDDSPTGDSVDMLLRQASGAHAWYRLRLIKKTDAESGEGMLVMSVNNVDKEKREEESTRAQLIRALNAAENANHAKGEFVTRLSHEIRTPLNAILSFLDLAQENLANPERMGEYLARTKAASAHLLSIINDALDLTAVENGQIAVAYESYDLKEVVKSVTGIVYPLVHKKNIQFQIFLDEVTEERLMGDKVRVSQILLNLLSNAVKFTPQNGEVSLTIRQKSANSKRLLMEFIVKDNGIGMRREFIEQLGRPFAQQEEDSARRYGGSGLGLSIAKSLIALMNGVMTVESVEGRGSTFTVTLPTDVERTDPSARDSHAFPDALVLVIDRETATAEQARACFRTLGCRCDCVTSGRAALTLCMQNNYNLVLMDWKLPDLDGESIIAAIRQAVDNEPTIVIMAYDPTEVSEIAELGAVFLRKPIFPSSILDLLLQVYGEYDMAPAQFDAQEFRGKRLLLAEDNGINMDIARRILTQMGFAVTAVADGQAAYETFLHSGPDEYDAILMDIQMPVLNGYEATKRIRACSHPAAHTIPILAMTANSFVSEADRSFERGMNGHIAKPIDFEQMRKTLRENLL